MPLAPCQLQGIGFMYVILTLCNYLHILLKKKKRKKERKSTIIVRPGGWGDVSRLTSAYRILSPLPHTPSPLITCNCITHRIHAMLLYRLHAQITRGFGLAR